MKNEKLIFIVGIFILLSTLVFTSAAAISPSQTDKSVTELAIAKYKTVQSDTGISDEEKIKTAIDAYFTVHYEGQKLLAAQDFSELLEDETLE